eukprot:3700953-Karenia_brevis.AAC.1
MLRVQHLAEAGNLSTHARWILRTRLVLLEKPGRHKLRPIRVGEFLRPTITKRMIGREGHTVVPALRSMRQWGVQMS